MRSFSGKYSGGNKYKHFIFYNLLSERHAMYEIMWKNMAEPGRPQMANHTTQESCDLQTALLRQEY